MRKASLLSRAKIHFTFPPASARVRECRRTFSAPLAIVFVVSRSSSKQDATTSNHRRNHDVQPAQTSSTQAEMSSASSLASSPSAASSSPTYSLDHSPRAHLAPIGFHHHHKQQQRQQQQKQHQQGPATFMHAARRAPSSHVIERNSYQHHHQPVQQQQQQQQNTALWHSSSMLAAAAAASASSATTSLRPMGFNHSTDSPSNHSSSSSTSSHCSSNSHSGPFHRAHGLDSNGHHHHHQQQHHSPNSTQQSQHQSQQQQQPQQQINTSRYKTELCRPFEENGTCKYGEKCQFAHGLSELRTLTRHPKYKTEFCRTFHTTGFCPYGPRCHFIHNSKTAPTQAQLGLSPAAPPVVSYASTKLPFGHQTSHSASPSTSPISSTSSAATTSGSSTDSTTSSSPQERRTSSQLHWPRSPQCLQVAQWWTTFECASELPRSCSIHEARSLRKVH